MTPGCRDTLNPLHFIREHETDDPPGRQGAVPTPPSPPRNPRFQLTVALRVRCDIPARRG